MKIFKNKGQSLIEVAVFIPIFLICLYGTIEFTMLYITSQRVWNLSRDVAYTAYRDCVDPTNVYANCIDNSLTTIVNFVTGQGNTNMLKNFNTRGAIVLRIYTSQNTYSERTYGSIPYTSKLQNNPPAANLIAAEGRLVVSEVFYTYTPHTLVNNLLKIAGFPTVLYGSSTF